MRWGGAASRRSEWSCYGPLRFDTESHDGVQPSTQYRSPRAVAAILDNIPTRRTFTQCVETSEFRCTFRFLSVCACLHVLLVRLHVSLFVFLSACLFPFSLQPLFVDFFLIGLPPSGLACIQVFACASVCLWSYELCMCSCSAFFICLCFSPLSIDIICILPC